jgi:hypothetical protein
MPPVVFVHVVRLWVLLVAVIVIWFGAFMLKTLSPFYPRGVKI